MCSPRCGCTSLRYCSNPMQVLTWLSHIGDHPLGVDPPATPISAGPSTQFELRPLLWHTEHDDEIAHFNACSANYISNAELLHDTWDGPKEEQLQSIFNNITKECEAFEKDPGLKKWSTTWQVIDRTKADLVRFLIMQLFAYAFTIELEPWTGTIMRDHADSHVWSWCLGTWVSRREVIHCSECKKCYRDAWHCKRCGVCKSGRLLACDKCGGWSSIGVSAGIDHGKAMDAEEGATERRMAKTRKRIMDGIQSRIRSSGRPWWEYFGMNAEQGSGHKRARREDMTEVGHAELPGRQ
jgi:hypothetical protein